MVSSAFSGSPNKPVAGAIGMCISVVKTKADLGVGACRTGPVWSRRWTQVLDGKKLIDDMFSLFAKGIHQIGRMMLFLLQ